MKTFAVIFLALFFVGCPGNVKPPPSQPASGIGTSEHTNQASSAADSATIAADQAQQKAQDELKAAAGRAKANMLLAQAFNDTIPESPAQVGTDGELKTGVAQLTSVPADAQVLSDGAVRRIAVLNSTVAEAKAKYTDEVKKAEELSRRLVDVEKEKAVALAERDAARDAERKAIAEEQAAARKAQVAYDKAIADYKKEADKKRQHEMQTQVLWCRLAGFACLGVFLVGTGFGKIEGAKLTWPFSIFCLVLLGLAQLISQPWFKYAIAGAVVIAVGCEAIVLIRAHKKGQLAEEVRKQADSANATLKAVVPVLDDAYEKGTETLEELAVRLAQDNNGKPCTFADAMDKLIFDKLSTKMQEVPVAKSYIHKVRDMLAGKEATPA